MPLRLSERTPSGPGAVSVVAISGAGALDVVRRLVARPVVLGTPVLARLRLSDEDVDEILVCASAEDEVELHLHGSVPLVRTVLARLATEHGSGSVSSHAAHGVLERRAVALAPHAASEAGARILLDQAQGALRTELERLVVLESIERDDAIERLLERARVAGFALERTTVVLAGPPNAGKSTLFNVLLGRERAITHGRAGTTRDVLAEEARLGPWPVLLCDTAGIRELRAVDDPHGVEAEGQTRAAQIAESATLVFWLTSPDFDLEPPPRSGARWIRLGTQSDRGGVGEPRVSALQDPEDARRSVEREFRRAFQLPSDPWVAGTPVPFDARLCADLVACRTPASREMVAARLRSWLE